MGAVTSVKPQENRRGGSCRRYSSTGELMEALPPENKISAGISIGLAFT
jgi:hypothetical protein